MPMSTFMGSLTAPEPSAALSNGGESFMSATLMAPLNELQALAHILFHSLSPVQTKPPPAPPLSAFLQCDDALSSAVNLAQKHQIKQRRIDALEVEVLELEARWRVIATELEKGKRELEELIEEGENRVRAIEEAKKGQFASSTARKLIQILNSPQLQYHTPNFSPMPRASVPSRLHRQICPLLVCWVNRRHHCSFRHFQTKKRCAGGALMQKHLWGCLGKPIPLEDVR